MEALGATNPFYSVDSGAHSRPVDWNVDGHLDLIVGAADGTIRLFLGSSDGSLVEATGAANPFNSINFGSGANPVPVHWTNSGYFDLIVGVDDGTIKFFRAITN